MEILSVTLKSITTKQPVVTHRNFGCASAYGLSTRRACFDGKQVFIQTIISLLSHRAI